MTERAFVERKRCRLCDKLLVFGITAEGAKVPLDSVAPVYYVSNPETAAQRGHAGLVIARQATRIDRLDEPDSDEPWRVGGTYYGEAILKSFLADLAPRIVNEDVPY